MKIKARIERRKEQVKKRISIMASIKDALPITMSSDKLIEKQNDTSKQLRKSISKISGSDSLKDENILTDDFSSIKRSFSIISNEPTSFPSKFNRMLTLDTPKINRKNSLPRLSFNGIEPCVSSNFMENSQNFINSPDRISMISNRSKQPSSLNFQSSFNTESLSTRVSESKTLQKNFIKSLKKTLCPETSKTKALKLAFKAKSRKGLAIYSMNSFPIYRALWSPNK